MSKPMKHKSIIIVIAISVSSCIHEQVSGEKIKGVNRTGIEKIDQYRETGIRKFDKKSGTFLHTKRSFSVHDTSRYRKPKPKGYCKPVKRRLELKRQPKDSSKSVYVTSRSQRIPYHAEEGAWLNVYKSYYVSRFQCIPLPKTEP